MADRELTVIGYHESGKTTFAAALWHLVDSGEVNETVLIKGKHNGDFVYLEKIADTWAEGYAVERTKLDEFRPIRINLQQMESNSEISLSFVDLSGETFERLFATRALDERIDPLLGRASGVMLFVSALHVRDDVSLLEFGLAMPDVQPPEPQDDHKTAGVASVDELFPQAEFPEPSGGDEQRDGLPPHGVSDALAPSRPEDFRPERTPQQVQIVDLLDALCDAPVYMRLSRICVVISAWDRAPPGTTPEVWLANRMPLLHQYLQTHQDTFETRIYGVSAQGGHVTTRDRKNEASDREELLREKIASHRIKVLGYGAGPHDLTHPVAWLSGLET